MVPQTSARLETGEYNEFTAKHSELSRFRKDSKEYEVVSQVLKRWASLIDLPATPSKV